MLSKVEISNFQSHRKTSLEFVPGTNVIIGESDAGKSAVFRAINWAASNRPLGDAFRSEWGGETKVVLHTTEGDVIERIRTDTRNEYVINGQVLKAFGTEVPEEVLAILRLDPAGIQSQMDVPFLLADSPGEAARKLNKAASLDDIDHTISTLKSAYTSIGNDLKFNQGKLTEYQKQLRQFENLPDLEDRVQRVEQQEKERQGKQARVVELVRLVSEADRTKSRLQELEHIPVLWQKQEEVQRRFTSLSAKNEALKRLKTAWSQVSTIQEYLVLTTYVEEGLLRVQQTQTGHTELKKREARVENLKRTVKQVRVLAETDRTLQQELEALEQAFHELSPETCPLCGARMGGDNRETE